MPDRQPVLDVHDVSMRFCRDTRRSLRYGLADIAAELWPWRKADPGQRVGEFSALEHVSFTVNAGEAVAIAGRNGAGKTTLLRMIAGLLKPDTGEINVRGRVNPVIELGRGLNSQLTGRENARLGLVWRGMALRATEELAGAIAEFSELGPMFDAPVATYSAGMRARLAFAISAHVPCDLMLLDEVLAVGDIAFQQKCMRFMLDFLDGGGSLLFVSHDPGQMQHVCRRGLLLEHGRVLLDAKIENVIDKVFEIQTSPARDRVEYPVDRALPRILAVDPVAQDEDAPVVSGQKLGIRVRYWLPEPTSARFVCQIWTRDMKTCVAIFADDAARSLPGGEGELTCVVPDLPLVRGQYSIRASLVDPELLVGIAEWGQARPPSLLEVDEPVTRETMLRQNMAQLVHIPFHWEETQPAGREAPGPVRNPAEEELDHVG